MPVTCTFWYRIPGWDFWARSEFTAATDEIAIAAQRRHWDNLQSLGYELSARP